MLYLIYSYLSHSDLIYKKGLNVKGLLKCTRGQPIHSDIETWQQDLVLTSRNKASQLASFRV
jgi:hypothetical protein